MKKKIGAVLLVIIMALALGLPAPPARAASIIYVDWEAAGANDGTSWDDAYTDLQSALAIAGAGDEIWVAEGTYYPTDGDNRYATFNLKGGVALYGGFTTNPDDPDERDPQLYETILSGEIGDGDNSYHVVTSQGTNGTILDGFTVTGGNADYPTWPDNSGGGININGSTITVKNTIIYNNTAAFRGGGLNIRTTAGMEPSNVNIANSIIRNNISEGTVGAAGAYTGGGGICLNGPGTLTVINSIINGNIANFEGTRNADGGGIRVGGGNTQLNIINSTIVNNTCQSSVSGITGGGGIRSAIMTAIINSIFWGNEAGGVRNQIYCPPTTTAEVTYSNIEGGYPGDGNINQDPQFVSAYDNLRLQASSPAIDAGNNKAVPKGVTVDLDGNPRIVNRTVDMGAFEYLTAVQVATQDLIKEVNNLVDDEILNSGQGNSLIVKLEAAFDKMHRNDKTAINQLEAFINQVEDFIEKGILSEEEGQPLIEAAKEIIDDIS